MSGGGRNNPDSQLPGGGRWTGSLLEQLRVAAFVLDVEGRIALWGPEAERLFGYSASEVLGRFATEVLAPAADRTASPRDWLPRGDGGTRTDVRPVRTRDGDVHEVEFRHRLLKDPRGEQRVLAFAADALTVRRAETDLALTESLLTQSPVGLGVVDTQLRWLRVNPALTEICGQDAEQLVGSPVGQLRTGIDLPEVAAALREAIDTGEPLADRQIPGRSPREPEREQLWSASFYRVADSDGRTLGAATSVVDVTSQHRAAAEIAEAREHLSMVAEAGTRIGTTLDVERTTQELADVTVPRLANLAAVDVLEAVLGGEPPPAVEPDGSARFRALALSVAEPGETAQRAGAAGAVENLGTTASYGPNRPITRCVTEARPILLTETDADALRDIARDGDTAADLAAAGVHSYLVVPLIARGSVLGTLSLCRTPLTPRPFDARDLELAVELAGRAAISVDNARLYSRERNAALTLQRGLLPDAPRQPLAVDLAFRYRPAVREIGGDWFDVLPLGGDRVGLMVGDVMGKGVHAAAIMGQLRSTTRALARLNLPTAELLSHLDATAQYLSEAIATCVWAVCDAAEGWCELTVAGHLPPVVVAPDGAAELVDLPAAAPLGVGSGGFQVKRCRMPPGATLALFTDGLVEDRSVPIDVGLGDVRRLLTGPPRPLEETCDRVLGRLPDAPQDDVALLLARF